MVAIISVPDLQVDFLLDEIDQSSINTSQITVTIASVTANLSVATKPKANAIFPSDLNTTNYVVGSVITVLESLEEESQDPTMLQDNVGGTIQQG